MAKPILRTLLICDEVRERDDGQRDIFGVKGIFTTDVPAKALFRLYAVIDDMPPGEAVIGIVVANDSGAELSRFEDIHQVHPELNGRFNHIYTVRCDMDSHGAFEIIYFVGGQELGRFPFRVEPALPILR